MILTHAAQLFKNGRNHIQTCENCKAITQTLADQTKTLTAQQLRCPCDRQGPFKSLRKLLWLLLLFIGAVNKKTVFILADWFAVMLYYKVKDKLVTVK